jgi:hypothetical protein
MQLLEIALSRRMDQDFLINNAPVLNYSESL